MTHPYLRRFRHYTLGFFRRVLDRDKSQVPVPSVIVWAPAVDPLTRETALWAKSLTLSREVASQRLIGEVSRESIERCLAQVGTGVTIAVFLGHGLDHALLGSPPELRDGVLTGSVIYDDKLLQLGPQFMFAYCCFAGNILGANFGRRSRSSFLGFKDKIPIVVKTEASRKTWISLLQATIDGIVRDRAINASHKDKLYQYYEDAFWYYQSGSGRDSDDSLLMKMYLLRQQDSLIFFAGGVGSQ